MGLIEFIVAPFLFAFILFIAFFVKKRVPRQFQSIYFNGLALKLLGSLSVGIIYHTVYSGDTNQYYQSAQILNSSLIEDPSIWLKLILSNGSHNEQIYAYASRIYNFQSVPEMLVIKFAAISSLFVGGSYLGISFIFALFSFSGIWAWYSVVCRLYPQSSKSLGWAFFYIPSLFFWGSGLLKDAIIIGAIGWLFYCFYWLFIKKRKIILAGIAFIIMAWLVKSIRVFMLAAFMAPAIVWIFLENTKKIKSLILRYSILPITLCLGILGGIYIINNLTGGDTRYDPEVFGERAKISAEYLYMISEQQGGSGYYLGDLDGTFAGTLKLAPEAIWVSLFRPYIWESQNLMMLLSALESLFFLSFFFYVLIKVGLSKFASIIIKNPYVLFAVVFTVVFAFAIGITTYNFGTLVRYRIPLIPFFLSALIIIRDESRRHGLLTKFPR